MCLMSGLRRYPVSSQVNVYGSPLQVNTANRSSYEIEIGTEYYLAL